eukprot:487255-Prorocentrum_minimum.AAC.1
MELPVRRPWAVSPLNTPHLRNQNCKSVVNCPDERGTLSTPPPANPLQGGNKNLPCPERVMPIAFAPVTYSSRAATGHNTTSAFRRTPKTCLEPSRKVLPHT